MSRTKRHTTTYTCSAYPFPHRIGGGKCEEDYVCRHGQRTPEHPGYDRTVDYCRECEQEEYADYCYDWSR